jgi:biopolymer transport protein ExbD
MRIPTHHDRQHQELAMTPMIDVVFLLLIFFVCTASFQIAEQILPSSILASGSTQAPLPEPVDPPLEQIVVRTRMIAGQPAWTINEVEQTALAGVGRVLRAVHEIDPNTPVILHNQPDVPLGSVIDVYDLARVVGFDKVQFAVSE